MNKKILSVLILITGSLLLLALINSSYVIAISLILSLVAFTVLLVNLKD